MHAHNPRAVDIEEAATRDSYQYKSNVLRRLALFARTRAQHAEGTTNSQIVHIPATDRRVSV